jgi:hypothetical protein
MPNPVSTGTTVFISADGDSPVGAARATGWWKWTDPLGSPGALQASGGHAMEDLAMNSNLVIFWAANTAETEQPQMKHFIAAQERGARLITIDPINEAPSFFHANSATFSTEALLYSWSAHSTPEVNQYGSNHSSGNVQKLWVFRLSYIA